jgi:23S rRNA pseudouridine1911/1915/1917 synthase
MPDEPEILFLDNHLLAVNKPAGLVTQPSGAHADSMESRAKAWLKQELGKPGNVFLEAVHRIDRPVSGVVLFARTSKALSRLNASQRAKDCEKTYLAVVSGTPPAARSRLEDTVVHDSRCARVVAPDHPRGKRALLEYEVLGSRQGNSLLRIRLLTGRYHQIRVQLAHTGCPIVGDRTYGSSQNLPGNTIALHHWELRIPHPVGERETCRILAPLPRTAPWDRFVSDLPHE